MRTCWGRFVRLAERYCCSCMQGVVDQATGSPLADADSPGEVSNHNPMHSPIAHDIGRIAAATTGLGLSIAIASPTAGMVSGVALAADVQRLGVHIHRETHRRHLPIDGVTTPSPATPDTPNLPLAP